jgi:SAM-dependent methyltransferase
MSWDERLADDYDLWSANMTADIDFYVALARQAEGPLVELAVGGGRVAIPVARATGKPVIGIDASPAMLTLAREAAVRAGVELDLRESDMTAFTLAEPAGLIYCPFHGLLHLPTWAKRRRLFERVAASIRPDGRFAWNALAFDFRIAARFDGLPQNTPTPHTTRFSIGTNRIDIEHDNGATSSLWWATLNEWLGLIDIAGLEVESLRSGFNGEPFDDTSTQYVFVTRPRRLAPPSS